MKPQPPQRALRFLRWFCREDYLEEFEGDLIELFEQGFERSPVRARIQFFLSVMRCFRPGFIKTLYQGKHSNNMAMFQHNLLITLRNFRRYKGSFLINLTGLSVGLLSTLLIYFWVYSEVTVDTFHENDKQLYQVLRNIRVGTNLKTTPYNTDLLVPALRAELAEVEYAVPLARVRSEVYLSLDDKKIKTKGKLVGKDFFKIFSFDLIKGDRDRALSGLKSIVLSKQLAERLSDNGEVAPGEVISLLGDTESGARYADDFIVTGIFDLSNQNTSEEFDFLLTNELFLNRRGPGNDVWYSNGVKVYITLKEGTDIDQFNEKLNTFYQDKRVAMIGETDRENMPTMFVRQYSRQYLYGNYSNGVESGGRVDYTILFSAIGLMVLLVACINFMNLSTAQAFRRLKEVGVKKVVGASRRALAFQYATESVMLAVLSSLIAVFGAIALYPKLAFISGREVMIAWTLELIYGIIAIALGTGVMAGSYPAFFISGLRPMQILKGKLKTSVGEMVIRKGLVIFQFCVSLILIVTVIVVNQQMEYVQSKNLGYDRDNILIFPREGALIDSAEPFLNEARNIKGVRNVAITQGDPTNFTNSGGGYPRAGQPNVQFTFARVGYDFVETLGIEIIEGRSFSREFANERKKIILNETALKAMELEDPIGKIVSIRGKREIIGIMKDFHFQSLHEEIKPSFVILVPEDANNFLVKVEKGQEQEVIAGLEELYQIFNPNLPLQFKFLDADYDALYNAEQRTAGLYQYFALIAVFISCLGLLGLSAFTVQLRLKEIGIRKVLGSGIWKIITLLTKDLTRTVFISLLISIPLGYYLSQNWLEGFAYRIDLDISVFIVSGLAVVLMAWAIVAFRALNAARVNPVECLKDE